MRTECGLLGRPWITTVCDSYSRCLMGFHIGFDAPSSHRVALALRHAILPKSYGEEYGLHCEWGTYGVPIFLYTDGGKDFRSNHLQQIGAQLGFTCYLRDRPSSGGIIERPFGTFNTSFFSSLPGYTGSNVKERPKNTEKEACLTIDELDKYIVKFFVDNYNQGLDTRIGDQSRFQRWEAGLSNPPILPTERELDLCLMKSTQRRVQRGGTIQFENILYRGENLGGYEGKQISLRYDPADITTIFVYCRDGGKEIFLTRAHALNLEASSLSFTDNKSAQKQLRESGKNISNDSILAEVENRHKEVAKTVKDRRQKAHSTFHSKNRMTNEQIEKTVEVIEETTSSLNSLELLQPVKTWDLDEDY